MASKTAFRFFVADEQRCSSTWSITIQGNDIYVSHSGSHHDKVSLHESGSYQWSVRSEHVAAVPFAKNDRHIARWKNPAALPGSLTRQFYVVIPATELQLGRPRPAKKATLIPAPSDGWAARFDLVFFTPHEGKKVTRADWNPKPLFEAILASGRILLIVHSTIPIDQDTASKISIVKATGRTEGEKHDTNVARALAKIKDRQGVSGMIEVSI